MGLSETLVRKLDALHRKAHYFVTSIALLGTLLVGSSLVAWHSSQEQQRLSLANRETLHVMQSVDQVRLSALNTLRSQRNYLLTGDPGFLKTYRLGRLDVLQNLADLEAAIATNGIDRDLVDNLRSDTNAFLAKLGTVQALALQGERDRAIALVSNKRVQDGIAPIDAGVERILEGERNRLHSMTAHVDSVTTTLLRFIYLMSFTGLCLLLLAVLSAMALRRSFARDRNDRDELQKLAETDELTGISNRRELLTYLDRRIAEARRTDTPLSFAMFDIDNFKRVNDSYGHAVGDEAIKHVVHQAQATVRLNDRIGRMGGEEFGIVLPKSSETNAYAVCERMRGRLKDQPFAIGEERLAVTISTGIAALTDQDDAASLIERADKALYEAKRNGRDQVKLAA